MPAGKTLCSKVRRETGKSNKPDNLFFAAMLNLLPSTLAAFLPGERNEKFIVVE
jgi:hypothetical protein